MADKLSTYRKKRNFSRTEEPDGKVEKGSGKGGRFVVQKHEATRLHWDLRLELDGVLKSWAVPKGPSLDPAEKRLAVMTEDHPLGYESFEGTIPKGEYGGGTMMVWDEGRWIPEKGKDPLRTLKEGHLHFTLEGERMKGEWILVRMKGRKGEKPPWLLRKVGDRHAREDSGDALVRQALTSVKSGRSMAEIASAKKAKKGKEKSLARPSFAKPQLATLAGKVPAGEAWIHEYKYDGYRALVATGKGGARIYTRNGKDWTEKFASIAAAAEKQWPDGCLVDGEIVLLGADGKPDFSGLQKAIKKKDGGRKSFFAFDLLTDQSEDITGLSNLERKQRLEELMGATSPPLHYADHVLGAGEKLLAAICAEGGEGIISKKATAPYRHRRTRNWLKVKCIQQDDFLILGWLNSDKKARPFRSLLLGRKVGRTIDYAGKVGTGFTLDQMRELRDRLEKIERKTPPAEIPATEQRGARFVTPKLAARIAYTEVTNSGTLRHPSFLGLEAPGRTTKKKTPANAAALATAESLGVKISSRSRCIYPDAKITKGELADYFAAMADLFLRDGAERLISLVRCPQGRAKKCFFQRHDSGSFGDAVHHLPVIEKDGGSDDYLWIDSAQGLLACVQMGTIEFHGWGSRTVDIEKPDRMVFDLDPDEGLGFDKVRDAALELRTQLGDMGLQSFAMSTGGKGIHVVVPLQPVAEWDAVKSFARRFASALAQAHPDRYTDNIRKAARKKRIFIDWLRNQRGATAILPYSARARSGARVAVPLDWKEVEALDAPPEWQVGDQQALIERSLALTGWGRARQQLPDI
ncbi:DNA ligase D [Sphingomicrobium lutaoense]|uniref:DNA ligase (ATP) n=1 Tax=Sphingomicrobium lutaoense TaxID=515949 RepID=A0A839YZW6_9SPHN|nr:DNA ligase D [Sphingomicrobium lutaoense]MBB3762992.1 bifunctional non-homologous end joining protein LigD [Sphingomicrobium lutaoense]